MVTCYIFNRDKNDQNNDQIKNITYKESKKIQQIIEKTTDITGKNMSDRQ